MIAWILLGLAGYFTLGYPVTLIWLKLCMCLNERTPGFTVFLWCFWPFLLMMLMLMTIQMVIEWLMDLLRVQYIIGWLFRLPEENFR
jgi:hypothetical protein